MRYVNVDGEAVALSGAVSPVFGYPEKQFVQTFYYMNSGDFDNEKTSWMRIVDPGLLDTDFVGIGGNGGAFLVDIGIADTVGGPITTMVENIGAQFHQISSHVMLPLHIPASKYIYVRLQAPMAYTETEIVLRCYTSSIKSPTSIITLGANTLTSMGTLLTTRDVWTEITPSTSEDYRGLGVGAFTEMMGTTGWVMGIEIGIGAAGSEVVISPKYTYYVVSPYFTIPMNLPALITRHIPSGSRLSIRRTGDNLNGVSAMIYGIL